MRHIWPDDQIAELGAARSHAHNALLRLHHRRSQGPARPSALDSVLLMDGADHIRLCDVGLAAEGEIVRNLTIAGACARPPPGPDLARPRHGKDALTGCRYIAVHGARPCRLRLAAPLRRLEGKAGADA